MPARARGGDMTRIIRALGPLAIVAVVSAP